MLDSAFFATDETKEVPVTLNGKTAIFILRTAMSVKDQMQIAGANIEIKVVNGKPVQTQNIDTSKTALVTLATFIKGYIPVNADGTRGDLVPLSLEQIGMLRSDVADKLSDEISVFVNGASGVDESFLAQ